jgi:hypothetical protein
MLQVSVGDQLIATSGFTRAGKEVEYGEIVVRGGKGEKNSSICALQLQGCAPLSLINEQNVSFFQVSRLSG